MSKKQIFKVVLTGGGTAGHVMPHLALIPEMKKRAWSLSYIGTKAIEKELIQPLGIPFYEITAGKLRRYLSLENFFDFFRFFIGVLQSFWVLLRIRPQVVFSKGGYVSVPVCLAAWVLRIPIVTHESDVTPGLANRIIMKFALQVFYSFPQSRKHLPNSSVQVTLPVRKELFEGSREKALEFCAFKEEDKRPTILVMGGSLGSVLINNLITESLDNLLENYKLIHITGKNKKTSYKRAGSYFQLEFAKKELRDLLALADLVVSRSGANSIFEYLALAKPMVLIPLVHGSRGDQIDNAKCFVANGWAKSLDETKASAKDLQEAVHEVFSDDSIAKALLEEKSKGLLSEHVVLDRLESFSEVPVKAYEKS